MKKIDLTGKQFGRITVIKEHGRDKHGSVTWECICTCGNKVYPDTHTLVAGHTQSCGCTRLEKVKMLNYKHGETNTRLYRCWRDMKSRCYRVKDKFYKSYGGRGIYVCDEWKSDFLAFKEWAMANGYNDTLTIDRIDVNGIYEPSNCRWSTQYEQASNRHTNRFVEYHGEKDTLTNMCRKLDINYNLIKSRIKRFGCSFEEAVDNYPHTSKFVEYWKK